jgi:hypothetical protein
MPSARLAPALDSLAPEASSPEQGTPGVVASSVYANGRRVADISIDGHTVIVAIFALCGILYWRFRKNGWL